ncbi:protein PHLOEM PROTEIN 2-LIKE A9 isoform X2 [Mercurialis annua]|uniref:protein PHLOEM PROTEIN 2-LIKE A9 isoform X2 n=1 Tax=Mercurialis annua TaxID=3986 RepID=UPI00215EDD0A|nr:protein PHLOEM PROTEIN 2-LIKE A9 isoform X2 [Mercurialis annua]
MSTKPHYEADKEIEESKPNALSIVWGNDNRYWIMPQPGREEGAKLLQVSWLEVTGTSKKSLTKGNKYGISFVIELTDGSFGWNGCPVFLMAKLGKKGQYKWQKVSLSDLPKNQKHEIPIGNQFTLEVPFDCTNDDLVLYFGLYEVWTGRWKGGLSIYEAKIKDLSSI